jgi:NMD protein affecting ribosome stability and mRNA decay
MRTTKPYNTIYKKNPSGEEKRYRFLGQPKGIRSCPGCGAVYFHGRWSLEPAEAIRRRLEGRDAVKDSYCPGCLKIRDRYAQGIVEISGIEPKEKMDILRLVKNEEIKARGKNPLERIIAIVPKENALRIETTTEKLAQRLGRALNKARGGRVAYKWSERNKFVRVIWQKSRGAASGI